MKRTLSSILALSMLVGSLAGCGSSSNAPAAPASSAPAAGSESAAASSTSAGASGPVELSVSWWGGDSRHEATQKALTAFTAANPSITTTSNYGAWTGWEDAMSTALYAGTAQDVNQVNWNWIYNYDNSGKTFVDLNTLSDVIDLSQFDTNSLAQCTIDGRLLCIPVSMTGRIFYWNEATFEKAGLSTPKTWAELLNAGKSFKEKLGDDFYPLAMNELDRTIFMVWALECKYGKDWVVDNKLNYSAEEIKEGLTLLQTLEQNHVIPNIQTLAGDGAESLDKNPKWMDGRYAGIFEWDSSAGKFQKALSEGQKFIVGDYFTDMGEYKGGFTKVSLGFAITQSCKNPKEAGKLINYLLNDPEGAKIMSSERGIPLSKAALDACNAEKLLDETVAEANSKVLAWCSNKLDPKFEDARLKALNEGTYYEAMAGLSYGDYDLDAATKVLMDGINDVLAQ